MPANGPIARGWRGRKRRHKQSGGCQEQPSHDSEGCRLSGSLLPRGFPASAAGYASGCPIPFPRSGIAVELAIRICTTDRDLDKALASDAAGHVGTGRGNLAVRNGKRRARRRFAAAAFCHDRDIPKPVIGLSGPARERRQAAKAETNKAVPMRLKRMIRSLTCVMRSAYSGTMCPKFAAPQHRKKFQQDPNI